MTVLSIVYKLPAARVKTKTITTENLALDLKIIKNRRLILKIKTLLLA